MTLSFHEQAILALFATSVLVRIVPVFIRPRLGEQARRMLERDLPAAVFINFSVYVVCTEIMVAPVAAITAIGLMATITLATRLGLLLTTVVSTMMYVLVQMWIRS